MEITKETKVHGTGYDRTIESLKVVRGGGEYIVRRHSGGNLVEEHRVNNDFIKETAFNIINNGCKLVLDFDFVGGVKWDELANHYSVEVEGMVHPINPIASKSNPQFGDYKFQAMVVDEEKAIEITKTGEHELVEL